MEQCKAILGEVILCCMSVLVARTFLGVRGVFLISTEGACYLLNYYVYLNEVPLCGGNFLSWI